MKTANIEGSLGAPAKKTVAHDDLVERIQRLEAAYRLRRSKVPHITDADRQKLLAVCADLLAHPVGMAAAKDLKWIRDSGLYFAAEGNFQTFCSEILGLGEPEAADLL